MSKEYRDTLNLPETDLSMKAGLPRKEPEILEFWNSINLYQKIREQNAGKPAFIDRSVSGRFKVSRYSLLIENYSSISLA